MRGQAHGKRRKRLRLSFMELVINFSGGKDSTAMLAYLCEKHPRVGKHVVYADTGWEHEDAEEWARSIVARFNLPLHVVRNPNKDFFQMVRHRRMFPSPAQRQCTSDLKRTPIQTWIRRNVADPVVVNCMGIRAEESPARAKKRSLSLDKKMSNGPGVYLHDEKRFKVGVAERPGRLPAHSNIGGRDRFHDAAGPNDFGTNYGFIARQG